MKVTVTVEMIKAAAKRAIAACRKEAKSIASASQALAWSLAELTTRHCEAGNKLAEAVELAFADVRSAFKEAGLPPTRVNKARALFPFALHAAAAADLKGEADWDAAMPAAKLWPSDPFAYGVLAKAGLAPQEAAILRNWPSLVEAAEKAAAEEFVRSCAAAGVTASPTASEITKRVAAFRAARTASPPEAGAGGAMSACERVLAVLQLVKGDLTPDDVRVIRTFLDTIK